MKLQRDENGQFPAYAWPGGYPLYYITQDNGVLCAKCANDYMEGRDTEEQLKPVAVEPNWENLNLYCENCNAQIESAYGPNER